MYIFKGGNILVSKDDIISYDMEVVFRYKDCEVTLKCFNDIRQVKIIGLNKNRGIIEESKAYIGKPDNNTFLMDCLNNNLSIIDNFYEDILNKYENKFDN
jgi:hypothetical protein